MEMVLEKLDLAKSDPNYYKAALTPSLRDLDPFYYLSFEGQSAPEDPYFLAAIEHLYAVAYGIKFLSKGEDNDFVVPKMEGLWTLENEVESYEQFEAASRDQWCWKIMIRMPDFIESEHFFRSVESARRKKPDLDCMDQVKFELFNEGIVAQVLHLGSYAEELPTIKKLHAFIEEEGMMINGTHHEIYLSDPRRTAPEDLRTIIRYPVKMGN